MKVVPRVLLIAIAALGMTGCRTFGPAPSPRLLPPPEPKTASFDVKGFVAEHNRNAELVESLQAKTQITGRSTKKFSRLSGGASLTGMMVMERPRNFKLELRADTAMKKATVADIGSNDHEFWFMNPDEKSIYTCKYDELPSTPLAVSFQPEWIVDALGMRAITPEEARLIKTRPGKETDTTDLVFPPQRSKGQSSTRIVTVSNQTRRIKAHRLYGGDGKLLAQAEISGYQETPLDDSTEQDAKPEVLCLLPQQIQLEWKQEQFSLDVNLKDVVLNNFDPKNRDAVFVEPIVEGYAHVNLAKAQPADASQDETTIRETLPAPRSRANRGVRLDAPVPESDDTSSTGNSAGLIGPRNWSTARYSSPTEPPPLETVVRDTGPSAPNSYDFQLADSLRGNVPPEAVSIER